MSSVIITSSPDIQLPMLYTGSTEISPNALKLKLPLLIIISLININVSARVGVSI